MQTRTLNDRYRLDEVVGEGGMAVVYRGYDLVLNRDVAVKLLRDQYGSDENFLARFDREAQSAARLSHPNIVNVYDVGEDNNVRYIVMENIEGPNLKELIRRQGPFTVDGAAFIIRQIANGLDFAHARDLVHRDIKPQNILVDNNGNVKVVDFGIAKGISDSNLTEAGTGMGTVHYVSPEQARGEQATPSSDVYSTGVVLYEMLTKTIPFDADSPVGVAMQHVNAVPPPPSEINPQLPKEIDEFIEIALAKTPEERFQSAGEMASALEALSRGEGIQSTGATRMMAAGGAAATAVAPSAAAGRGARRRPPGRNRGNNKRMGNFRDDVGCVTWLIGSAILIGLIGLVILAFRLGDFGLFEQPANETASLTPTATAEPSPSPTPELTATPEPTPEATETPEPSPTPEPDTVAVPQFVGGTLEQAQRIAGDLELEVEEVFSDSVDSGIIASQDPEPGTEVDPDATVVVRVSQGAETVSVPDLANASRSEAQNQLGNLPVNVEERWEPSQNIAEGVVLRVEPTGQVARGSTVTVTISMGDVVRVPNVFRQPVGEAISQLESAGLQVGSASPQSCEFIQNQNPNFNCEDFPDGHVVSGTLEWENWVNRGASIDIAYYDASAGTSSADDDDDDD
ncbi:MAG: serine/threonine-protein kinase [Sphaerobacteraceae bacterium]|nr:MAG: serine/threonine-protein kinase [Sphaerobacteraceae bacterium]